MGNIRVYKKGVPFQLSDDFTSKEFDCPCHHASCKTTPIDLELVEMLQHMRDDLNTPITINSGFRCQAHHEDLEEQGFETAKKSQHLVGRAADISAFGLNGKRLEKAARAAGFKAVGLGAMFIHVDTRSDKVRAWGYKKRG